MLLSDDRRNQPQFYALRNCRYSQAFTKVQAPSEVFARNTLTQAWFCGTGNQLTTPYFSDIC